MMKVKQTALPADFNAAVASAVDTAMANVGMVYWQIIERLDSGWDVTSSGSGNQKADFNIAAPKGLYLYQIYMNGDAQSITLSTGWVYAYGQINSAQAGGGWQGVRFPLAIINKNSDADWQETIEWSAWNPQWVELSLILIKPF